MTVRKQTAALDRARQYGQRFAEVPTVEKYEAVYALRVVASALGLTPGAMVTLEAMIAASQGRDWTTTGSRPVVWPSNERLCQMTGQSLPTLRRRIRELVDAGLVVPTDSPTGKRYGERDSEGRITVAYGFDLSPLAVRHAEFRELAARMAHQRALIEDWRREATVLRKRIQAIVEAGIDQDLQGDWEGYRAVLDAVMERYPRGKVSLSLSSECERLRLLTKELRGLVDMVEAAWRDIALANESETPVGVTDESDIYDYNRNLNPDSGSQKERHGLRPSVDDADASGGPSMKAGGEAAASTPKSSALPDDSVSLELVMQAAPAIREYTLGAVRTWSDLVSAAEKVRPWLGINEAAWVEAVEVLGPEVAATAVAVILQKHQDGSVRSPGGYLRGMVAKARGGDLHLARTLYGLANAPKSEARIL